MPDSCETSALPELYRELASISLDEGAVSYNQPSPKILNLAWEKEVPLIGVCPPRVNGEVFFEVMEKVCRIIDSYQPEAARELKEAAALLAGENPVWREAFACKAVIPGAIPELAAQFGLPQEAGELLLNYTVRPFLREYSKKVSRLYDTEQWLKGFCPVCGSQPSMALLEKEAGRRYLSCGWCGTRWRFKRLGCPYCSCEESQFFSVEGMERYRVYYCDKCRRYIKTVDERVAGTGDLDLFFEDISTIHLDLLARQEGYANT
jgi:FdhE protein